MTGNAIPVDIKSRWIHPTQHILPSRPEIQAHVNSFDVPENTIPWSGKKMSSYNPADLQQIQDRRIKSELTNMNSNCCHEIRNKLDFFCARIPRPAKERSFCRRIVRKDTSGSHPRWKGNPCHSIQALVLHNSNRASHARCRGNFAIE